MPELQYIEVSKIFPHPDNPRKNLGDIQELSDSIKANGVLQNLTVVPMSNGQYTVVIGHRRLAAAKKAGLSVVPCVAMEMTPQEQVRTMLMENIQRSDLTVYEQAQGFQMMLDMGETVDSTPELKNKALDAIGTANFRDVLKKAIEEEKNLRRMAQWETDLEAFALKIEKRDCVGSTAVPMDYVTNYGIWSPKDKMVERPEDAGEVRYYYLVGTNGIDLYKDHQERGETEEERQRKEKDRARNRVKAELREITERHYSLRVEFVSDFSAAKKHLVEICKYAVGAIVGDGEYGRDEINAELTGELLDLGIDDNTDYPAFTAMVEECADEHPEYALLVCAYASVDADDNGYWDERWNTDKREYEIVHEPNSELDRLYNFLVSLGYEMSDEEKAMRDGTHQLLSRRDA